MRQEGRKDRAGAMGLILLAGLVASGGAERRGKEEEHGEARGRGLRTGMLREEEAGNEPPARSGGGREDGSKGGGGGCWLDGADGGGESAGCGVVGWMDRGESVVGPGWIWEDPKVGGEWMDG